MKGGPLCAFCGDPVNPRMAGTHREVTGWEELRTGGGANKIVVRAETGQWAHRSCIAVERLRSLREDTEQSSFPL